MAVFDPGAGFERNDNYEPPQDAPYVLLEIQEDQGRVMWRTLRASSDDGWAPGNFGESHWMPAADAVKFALGGAGILEQAPVPYKVVGW